MRGPDGSIQLTQDQAIELLRKFGFGGLEPGPGASGSKGTETPVNPGTGQIPAVPGGTSNGSFDSGFYGGLAAQPTDGRLGVAADGQNVNRASGFSPFSPDPNYLANLVAEREANLAKEGASRALSSFPQRFGGSANAAEKSQAGDERTPPAQTSGAAVRTTTPSSNEAFGYGLNASAASFVTSRTVARSGADGTPSRPSSTQAGVPKEKDTLQDVNGTLASLHLDESAAAEKTRSPGEMTDSSGSVHFKISMNSPASPAV